jgi:glycosyltransferase involved in cell wall biosynthesis
MTLVSVVVPVYFSSPTLRALLGRLRDIAAAASAGTLFEFVMVDDGSTDESFAILQAEAAADPRVRALRLSRNFGSNAAILAGLSYAQGDACVVIAADLQDPPELIPELIGAWQTGADVVLAARRTRDDPFVSRIFALGFNRLFRRLVFPDFPPNGFDFMLVSRRVARQIVAMNERNSYIFGQIMWVGYERRVVLYDRAAREEGESRWTIAKKIKYFIDAFTAFSYLPVRAATLLGTVLALAGFVWAAVVVVARLLGWIPEAGFAAVMVALLVLSGTQLIVSGLIGEYLWRVLEESRNRPAFLVAQTANITDSSDGIGPLARPHMGTPVEYVAAQPSVSADVRQPSEMG